MNKKGFTLVEVIAVIVLLGLIISILVPVYNSSIEKGKKNSFRESLNGLVRTVENYIANNPGELSNFNGESYTELSSVNLEADNISKIQSGSFRVDSDGLIELKDVSNGDYCGSGTKGEWTIKKGSC